MISSSHQHRRESKLATKGMIPFDTKGMTLHQKASVRDILKALQLEVSKNSDLTSQLRSQSLPSTSPDPASVWFDKSQLYRSRNLHLTSTVKYQRLLLAKCERVLGFVLGVGGVIDRVRSAVEGILELTTGQGKVGAILKGVKGELEEVKKFGEEVCRAVNGEGEQEGGGREV